MHSFKTKLPFLNVLPSQLRLFEYPPVTGLSTDFFMYPATAGHNLRALNGKKITQEDPVNLLGRGRESRNGNLTRLGTRPWVPSFTFLRCSGAKMILSLHYIYSSTTTTKKTRKEKKISRLNRIAPSRNAASVED